MRRRKRIPHVAAVMPPFPHSVDIAAPVTEPRTAGWRAGIFTVADACRKFGENLRAMFPELDGGDAA